MGTDLLLIAAGDYLRAAPGGACCFLAYREYREVLSAYSVLPGLGPLDSLLVGAVLPAGLGVAAGLPADPGLGADPGFGAPP
ncbi:hypothetical protein, partial [Arthrobacter sp. H41]|uniref:hypothetical protein n=1 Tax=Arthrobacter sp. H41 TaxID=1312978 RepID=UPI001C1DD39F